MSSSDLDDVRRELAVLAERLAALPADAFSERLDIRGRQAELREIVRRHAVAGDLLGADQIRRRIAVVRRQIEAHYGNRLSTRVGPQTGMGGGLDPAVTHEMNRKMDALADIEGLRKELRQLQDRLASFESSEASDPPQPP